VLTPTIAHVVLSALRDGTPLGTLISDLPQFLSDTFLHLRLGYGGEYHKQLSTVMFDGLPVDVSLLAGGLIIGVVVGLMTGLARAKRRGEAVDHALTIGSAAVLSIPIYWFGFAMLALFAPQSGYLLQIPILSSYHGYRSWHDSPLLWLRSMWVPWVVLAIPLAAMCFRMTRASVRDPRRRPRPHGAREGAAGEARHAPPCAARRVAAGDRRGLGEHGADGHQRDPRRDRLRAPGLLPRGRRRPVLGEQGHIPGNDVIQALILEAATIIAVTMFLADLLLARLDPRVRLH